MGPNGIVLQVRDCGGATLGLKAVLGVIDERHLNIEGHAGSGYIEGRIAVLPPAPQLVCQVVADEPVPRERQEWRVRILETIRNRRIAAGGGRNRQTLLTVNVIAQVVFL